MKGKLQGGCAEGGCGWWVEGEGERGMGLDQSFFSVAQKDKNVPGGEPNIVFCTSSGLT